MLYFATRTKARSFANKNERYKFTDNGSDSNPGERWGVKVL